MLVSLTAAGRQVVDHATARRRALIEEILGRLPGPEQYAVAGALRAFAEAAGEIPDHLWPREIPDPHRGLASSGKGQL